MEEGVALVLRWGFEPVLRIEREDGVGGVFGRTFGYFGGPMLRVPMHSARVDQDQGVGGDCVCLVAGKFECLGSRVWGDAFRNERYNGEEAHCFVDNGADHTMSEGFIVMFVGTLYP